MRSLPFEEMEFEEEAAAPSKRPRNRPQLSAQRPKRPQRPQRPSGRPFPVPVPWPTGGGWAGTARCTCPCPVHSAASAGDGAAGSDPGFDEPSNPPAAGDAGELPFGELQELPFP